MDCTIDRARKKRLSHRCLAAYLLTAALTTLLAATAHGQSDIALFKNGDRLTGEIKSLDRGKVSFDTPTTGVINSRVGRYRPAVLHDDLRGEPRQRRTPLRNAGRDDR